MDEPVGPFEGRFARSADRPSEIVMRFQHLASLRLAALLLLGLPLGVTSCANHASPGVRSGKRGSGNPHLWESRLVRRGIRETRKFGSPSTARAAELFNGDLNPMSFRLTQTAKATLGGGQQLSLNFAQSRYVETPSRHGLWLVPGRAVLCLFRAPPSVAACDTVTKVRLRGLVLITSSAGQDEARVPRRKREFFATGIFPSSTGEIEVLSDGYRRRVSVIDGVFALRAEDPIRVKALHP